MNTWSLTWTLTLTLTLTLTACRGSGEDAQREEAVLVGLNEARAWERRADLHLQEGEVGAALADVREVLGIAFPKGVPEAEDVRLDARARLAQLTLRAGGEAAEEAALREIAQGQQEATRDSFFRANLESVAAEVYEARARRLGDPAAQKEARRLALAALERAIQIDRRVQRALLSSSGREAGR